jgi:histidinol phosphatase-like enzyme (inositol monophosphatase family)
MVKMPFMPKTLTPSQLKRFLSVARHAAQRGGQRALKYFNTKVPVIQKIDRSPVTRADREAEKVIRGILAKAFPAHQLCGEEFGWDEKAQNDFRWWIDPVDGTRLFIRGLPYWGTLVALEYKGEPVVGVIHHPAAALTIWAAQGMGCFANGKKAHVSKIKSLSAGTLTYGGMRLTPKAYRKSLTDLIATCYDDRGFGDCFGHGFVIMGQVEAMLDPVVKPYDVAAVKICVEEAGGRFTDLKGKKTIHGGNALSSNGLVHSQVLRAVR